MTSRMPDVDVAALPEATRSLLELTARGDGPPPATMEALAHSPDLLAPFVGWAAALALNGVLSPRQHELLALRAAWNCRSAFEWGEHVGYALDAGLTRSEIDAAAGRVDEGAWSDEDAELLRAADELHEGTAISDATWSALATRHSPAALVEITFVVGQYTMLSMVANGLTLPVPPDLPPLPMAG